MTGGKNGYLTVFMSLCIGVVLSLCLTLIEGARQGGAALEARCAADIGLQSVFAEYHRQLLSQYNLFAIDSSYGTGAPGAYRTEARLLYYLDKNLNLKDGVLLSHNSRDFFGLGADRVKITGTSILTDGQGAVFRMLAGEAIKDDIGLSALEEVGQWMKTIETDGLENIGIRQQKEEADRQLREYEYENEDGEQCVGVGNPTTVLEEKRSMGILSLTLGDDEKLSHNTINTSGLVYARMNGGRVNMGSYVSEELSSEGTFGERLMFQEYLLRYMGRYGSSEGKEALRYQIEYLIAGKDNDTENLRSVAERISAIREAANAVYLWNDPVKSKEVDAMAAAISAALCLPVLQPALKASILLGWAYAESIYDVKTILSGGKVPLMKDQNSWHYSLSQALSGGLADSATQGSGLGYEDYLRVLMSLTDLDTLTGRAMNMVEADIRMTEGNSGFRLDGCYAALKFDIRVSSAYGRQYVLERKWSYY